MKRLIKLALIILIATSAIVMIGVASLTEPTTNIQAVQTVEPVKTVQTSHREIPTPQRLLELTNAERVKAGVKPLIIDERLNKSAQKKVDELVREGWDSTPHVNNSGVHGYTYVGELMPTCKIASENIAMNYLDNPISGFKTSKAHWDAVLNAKYEYVGFSTSQMYVVVHFCSID